MVHRPTSRRLSLLSIALLGGAALNACAAGSPTDEIPEEAIASVGQAIQGGYVDQTSTAVVGVIHFAQGNLGSCSGSLIAPNVVLTAQHCVAQITGTTGGGVACGVSKFAPAYPANSLFVTTRTTFSQNPADYHQSAEVIVPPDANDVCGYDVALLVLDEPIPASEATPLVPRVDSQLATDEQYYAIGYGQTADGAYNSSGTRHRRDDLFISCVGSECPAPFVKGSEWVGDTGVCQGDSGGPALDLYDRVVGVASRGSAGCDNPVYGDVFSWSGWLKDVTLYASSKAGIDPPSWATGYPTDPGYSAPVGGECTTSDECESNACLDGYCTRICNDLAACPEGYACNGDTLFCEQIPEPIEAAPKPESVEVSSCSLGGAPADPTNPIPWALFVGGVGLAVARRRRG